MAIVTHIMRRLSATCFIGGGRTSFSVRGPGGDVSLGDVTQGEGDEAKVLRAEVTGPMPPGSYTVSWVGAPPDDHPVRGRFGFSIEEARRRPSPGGTRP